MAVLAQFYFGVMAVLAQFYFGVMAVLAQFYFGVMAVLAQFYFGVMTVLAQFYFGVMAVLAQFYFGESISPDPPHPLGGSGAHVHNPNEILSFWRNASTMNSSGSGQFWIAIG